MGAAVRVEAERVEDLAVPGHVLVAVGFAEWGRPTVLLTDEGHAEVPVGRTGGPGQASFARRRATRPWPATVVRRDGTTVDLGPSELTFPLVTGLADGGWVVVASRCRPGDENAAVHAPDGTVRRRLPVGDGVEWCQATRQGLWVGWFDEGVVGGAGPAEHGLARVPLDDGPWYRYDPPSRAGPIVDCYALAAAEDATWACTYPDFPLVRIRPDGGARAWRTDVAGATALAVRGSRVLLHGGYGDQRHAAHLGRLGRDALEAVRPVELVDEQGQRLEPDRAEGRGRHLHLLCGTEWWRVDVAALPA